MGELLFDLEQVLRSKQVKLTSGEVNVLLTCKSKAVRDFTAGTLVGSGVAWLASRRLNKFFRVNLSAGAAVILGLWSFGRSMDLCVDHILAQDGSQMQKELANIIVNKYRDDPWRMKLISKHFFSEKVYDDSTSDQPKLRWRYKNYFSDNVTHGQETHESDSQDESHSDSHNYSSNKTHSDHSNEPISKKNDMVSKQTTPVNPGVGLMADPLDCVFGNQAAMEEIHHHSNSSMPSRVHTRNHRRYHRRHRIHRHEVSLDPEHA
ncbi:hypothetical protein EZV62_000652 [Acer yangbiense]|uniref:Uncharacterized protein n=1 Tax=Acer yangbiense TaxID=1000413 RepID=A0A5C7IRQ9_9ROSI|nr:hypothetical protein EZV62_000652 [Acer yangbiense]